MRKLRKPVSILLSLVLILGMFTIIPVTTAGAAKAEVSYVDEYGSEQTVTATILTGEEAEQGDGSIVLGVDSNTTTTWYAVLDDVTYGDEDSTVNLEILGRVCIIVADGKTLTVNGAVKKSPNAQTLADFYLYGQSGQTGAVSADSIDLMDNIVVCGGSLTVDEIDEKITNLSDGVIVDTHQGALTADTINAQRIRVYGGELNADVITTCFTFNDGGKLNTRILNSKNPAEQPDFSDPSIVIQGGITNISGLVRTNGMELGCSDMDSRITIYDFDFDASTNTKKVTTGQTLTDGDRDYSGSLSEADLSAMAKKSLMKAHEHSANTMRYHPAAEPSYDPSDGSYTNGNVAYYTCPTCGLNYVEENGSFVQKTLEEVTIPYFSYRTTDVSGNTLCEVVGYNGHDADIVIPDTVPDNYPDSSQVGNTVTGIDHNVFKDNTVITSVTTGDDLRGINEGAFEGCTALATVTTGSSFNHIGAGAFKGCTALTSFTSPSSESIYYVYNDEHNENSFDTNCSITFNGPHGSSLCDIANDYSCSFIPSDDHTVTWAWSADYSSATATFICVGCQQSGKEYEADVTKDGVNASATVTVEGKTYTERIDFAVAMIEPDRYYASVADALPYAYANDAVIILLKDASFQYTNELCELYPAYKLKENGHTYNPGDSLACYELKISAPDENGVVTYSVDSTHNPEGEIYYILEEEAGDYTIAIHNICPVCDFDTVLRHDAEMHAAAAPTCTETGNIEYYSYSVESGNSSTTSYFVLKAPAQADHENELELLGTDVADVTIPANGHRMTAHRAVEPMLIVEGNSAYWSCDVCGRYFSDENGEHEIAENSWIIPGTATLVPTSYIDENGEEQTVGAIVLTGDEPEDYHSTSSGFYYYNALGDASDVPIWYVVNQDVSLTHENDNWFKRNVELTGDVRIIVADGATLTVQGEIKDGSLSVYGQTNQTGKLIANNINYCNSLSVCSGGLTVNTSVSCNKLAIYSGTTDIAGNTSVNESLLLGCNDSNDSITFGSLTRYDDETTASIVSGQILTDGVNNYSDNLSNDDLSAISGKTLVKAHEHNKAEMEFVEGVAPRYNPLSGVYENGIAAHYDCDICGGHFVLEDNQLVSKTDEELVVLYYVFQGNPIPGYTDQCWVHEYNGTDADVIIPDTVPADYPVSTMRGKTVIAVDGNAFKGKSFITSVTAGDALARIYSSAFEGCNSLETVTVGNGLESIGTDAFKGCTALKSFTSSSLQDITFSHNTDDPEHPQQSFDIGAEVVFRGPHGSSLLAIADHYDTIFSPTDRHVEPVWTWAADYCSATATFACSGCQLDGDEHSAAITRDGTVYTATVTVDGKDYTDTVDVAESAAAMIAPDHYYADFRSAIVAAHDDYNDAEIELLKDTSFTWDLELCKNYPSFTVKRNSHTLNYTAHSCYPVSMTDDTADVVTYTASADHTELTLRSVLNESDGEYSIIIYFLCGNCGERVDETTYEAEKHAAKAATCTETGNIEYYIISEETDGTVITYYYVLADSPEYENEVTCVVGDEIAAVTVPIDPDNHPTPLIYHPAVEPTLTTDGNSAYYECSGCHKYFSDATGSVEISENSWILNKTAVAKIAPDHYFADFRSAIVAAHDDYNDAVIELLKDTTLSWDLELCQNYTPFRVKMNGHSIDSISQPPCYAICSTDDTAEIVTYSVESNHDVDLDSIYSILEEEAGNYTIAVHMICPICGFDTVLRNDIVKHAAKAATCTETGNIEYYSIFVENGNYPFTRYYVLKDPDQAVHENELELLGTDVADVTIPIDPDAHQLTYHPAVEPTFTTEGNIAYWTCDICGKYFSDENGEHEITQAQTVVSSTAVAMIAPDHYYTDFRSAIVAAHDDYNDAIIELLKDTTLSWDLELCQNYTPFRVKMNGHSIDSISQPPCYAICSTDDTAEIVTYSVESNHDVDLDSIYSILEEEAGNYTIAVHMICPICGFDTVLRNDIVKHAAKAATCTETGNIEYYSNFVENGNYSFTRYYVLKDPDQADHENELELLGTDVADVTIPIDPDAHQIINDPEWSWTGSDSEGYTSATATFTCSRCSATETVTDTAVTSKTNDGSITYTATVEFEGKTYTTSKQVFDDGIGARLVGHSISLDGDIGVNFYMELADDIATSDSAYMHFIIPVGNGTTAQDMSVKDARVVKSGDKTYYVFKCRVAAKEMTSSIQAQIIDGDKQGTLYTYSVKQYADYLIEHQDEREDLKNAVPLVKAMLNYGGYSQVYFDKNPTNLANQGLTEQEKALGEVDFTVADPVDYLPDGVQFEGATLSLKSVTTLSLYFTADSEPVFSCKHPVTGENMTIEPVKNGNYWVARIRGIEAKNIGNTFTLNVNSGTITYSPLNYIYNVLNGGTDDENLKNAVKALYWYWKAANAYFPE